MPALGVSEVRLLNAPVSASVAGDWDTYASMVHPSVLPHIAPIRQRDLQAYKMDKANFVLHFVGNKRTNKRQELVAVLKALNQ